MKLTGHYTFDAPRQQVWDALNDIEVLARIVPGCQRLEQVGDNEFEGTLKIGIQAIKGTYTGSIRLEDIRAPEHYRLIAKGRSASGVVDGVGTIDLAEQAGKTVLTYGGEAQIGGTLASVGQRLIDGASKQLLNQSLKALAEQIAQRRNGTTGAAAAPQPREPAMEQVATAPPPPAGTAPAPAAGPPPAPPAARRFVEVPGSEQLTPESMVWGMVDDFVKARPWLPWVVVAFLLGFILGRART